MPANSTNPTDIAQQLPILIQSVIVERVKLRSHLRLSSTALSSLHVTSHVEHYADELWLELECVITGTKRLNETARYEEVKTLPDGKWQAIKEYFLPFLKKYFPVRYKTIVVKVESTTTQYYLCPHRELPANHSEHVHFLFEK